MKNYGTDTLRNFLPLILLAKVCVFNMNKGMQCFCLIGFMAIIL